MKLGKAFLLYIAAAGLLLSSCAHKEMVEPAGGNNRPGTYGGQTMTFSATMERFTEENGTKAVLGGSEMDKVRTMMWEPGDEVFAYGDSRSWDRFINVNGDLSARATFEGTFSESDVTLFYPFSMVDTAVTQAKKDGCIYFNLPSEQKYVTGGVASGSFPMVARKVTGDTTAVKFMNCCGIIALKLLSDDEDLRVNSITLRIGRSGSYSKLSGKWHRNHWCSPANPDIEPEDEALDYVTLNCLGDDGKGVTVNSATPAFFYIVIPTCSGGGVELDIRTDDGIARATSSNYFEINRSQLRRTSVIPYTFIVRDLSAGGTANSYIAPELSRYEFKTVKGNSAEPISGIASADVLWESSGTGEIPETGSVVKNISYDDGYIKFTSGIDGNALIAARDASGGILWSWHIWVSEGYDPKESAQKYPGPNYAMDRNMGAVTASPGDAGANGLYYQWGRKDPFPHTGRTGTMPSPAASSASTGTPAYATAHPEVFITDNSINYDWYYTGSSETDTERWMAEKTIYDPCPPDWKVPSGGESGVYPAAFGSNVSFTDKSLWVTGCSGMDFGTRFGADTSVWYPAAGYLYYGSACRTEARESGYCWTSASGTDEAVFGSCLAFDEDGLVAPDGMLPRASGLPVRCVRADFAYTDASSATDLSASGTSNCYIASENGRQYKFNAKVQGCSTDPVEGELYKAKLLWESFGTGETPSVGDVVRGVGLSEDGCIVFTKGEKDGSAVIALMDSRDNILWSWHIWACRDFDPASVSQTYYDGSVMMDRNLGALTSKPSEDGTEGYLYQWGRKDPFPGNSVKHNCKIATTLDWPGVVSDVNSATIDYSIAHPTTFMGAVFNGDWLYPEDFSHPYETTRWQRSKTKYDPCPPGWSVPDGGPDGMWAQIMKTDCGKILPLPWQNWAVNLHGIFGDDTEIWYPANYMLDPFGGGATGLLGHLHTSSSTDNSAWRINIRENLIMHESSSKAEGNPVRCRREGTGSIPGQSYTDLSSDETANSYIADRNTGYKIYAGVAGNGSSLFHTSYGNDYYMTEQASYAEVLWESDGTAAGQSSGEIVSDISLNRHFIRFRTGDRDGNAVIALRDYDGQIIWSWHIWVVGGYDPVATAQNYNGKALFMDRNLGALSATPSDGKALGLLYQWGRKDPFLGSASKDNTEAASSEGYPWPDAAESTAETGSKEYAALNPQTFIKAAGQNQDWLYVSDTTLWSHTKTIHDPCPPGWAVPDGGDAGPWALAAGAASVASDYWDAAGVGFNFSGIFGTASGIWYPAAPYRAAGTGDLSTDDGGLYSTVTSRPGGVRYGMRLTAEGADLSYNVLPAAAAVSVRCLRVKE